MQVVATLSIVLLILVSQYEAMSNLQCFNDTVDFATKVRESSIVVYGKATEKSLKDGSDSTFHVIFRVDCILKGPIIDRFIKISEAGQVENRTFCQDFPLGRGFSIAFLERMPSNINDTGNFIPSDFVDMTYQANITDKLLAETCNLSATLPNGFTPSMTNMCPLVSTAPNCVINTTTPSPMKISISGSAMDNLDHLVAKSGTIQVDADVRSKAMDPLRMNFAFVFVFLFWLHFN